MVDTFLSIPFEINVKCTCKCIQICLMLSKNHFLYRSRFYLGYFFIARFIWDIFLLLDLFGIFFIARWMQTK
jgi:hypothetical protein